MAQSSYLSWRSALSASILAAFLVWMVWYVSRHWAEFRVIGDVSLPHLLGLYSIFVLIVAANGLTTYIILRAFGIRLSTQAWLALSVATSFMNWVTPLRGGAGFRAVYLKTIHRFALTNFVATFGAVTLVYTAVHGVLGLVAMAELHRLGNPPSLTLSVLFAGITLLTAIVMLVRMPVIRSKNPALRQLSTVLDGWNTLQAQRKSLLGLTLTILALALFTVIQYALAFSAIGVKLSPSALLFFVAARNMAMLTSITPGSLGITEAVTVFLGRSLNYTPAEGLLVQGLIRVVSITSLLAAFPFALHVLRRGASKGDAAPASPGPGAELQ